MCQSIHKQSQVKKATYNIDSNNSAVEVDIQAFESETNTETLWLSCDNRLAFVFLIFDGRQT